MIEYSKKKRKWILYTHDGSRILGTHDTYEDTLRQERAIQWAKHRRKNPADKLYCYAPLHMFWTNTQRLKKKVFHVTPYLDRVLKDGKLLPPSRTGNSVLGENIRSGKTIRGCLLSFFDDFQTAMNGCYSMTLYALITKGLMSEDQFSDLVTRQLESQGILHGFHMFDPQELHDIVMERFREDDANTLFALLERAFGFKNPRILTSAWVDDLPDTVEGILDAIGVLEVEIDRKYIADPSALIGKSMSIYEDDHTQPRGDFGNALVATREFVGRDWLYATDRELYEMTSHEGAQIAYSVNEICKVGSTELGLRPNLLMRYLMKNFGFESKDLQVNSDGNVTAFNEVTFVHSVNVSAEEIAIWNPLENEWRIPAPSGISVDESSVIALAGEVQLRVGPERLVPRGDLIIRGRRKNP